MITIPSGAQIISRPHWAGWVWFTKDTDYKIIRRMYYKGFWMDSFQLVHFRNEECYEQFTDDLDNEGETIANLFSRIGEYLPSGSVDNTGGLSSVQG